MSDNTHIEATLTDADTWTAVLAGVNANDIYNNGQGTAVVSGTFTGTPILQARFTKFDGVSKTDWVAIAPSFTANIVDLKTFVIYTEAEYRFGFAGSDTVTGSAYLRLSFRP